MSSYHDEAETEKLRTQESPICDTRESKTSSFYNRMHIIHQQTASFGGEGNGKRLRLGSTNIQSKRAPSNDTGNNDSSSSCRLQIEIQNNTNEEVENPEMMANINFNESGGTIIQHRKSGGDGDEDNVA